MAHPAMPRWTSGGSESCGISVCSILALRNAGTAGAGTVRPRRASTLEPAIRSSTLRRLSPDTFHRLPRLLIGAGFVAQCLLPLGCVHHQAIARPTGHMSYWEALAELH